MHKTIQKSVNESCFDDCECGGCGDNNMSFCDDKHFESPFNNKIQTCCTCGGCCLINQQFTLRENINSNTEGEIVIYQANEFETSCIPGGGSGITVQQTGSTVPFGTVIARNIGQNTFSYSVVPLDTEPIPITRTVPPGASVAITSSNIERVELMYPGGPIRALFDFNIFFYPPDPVIPTPE